MNAWKITLSFLALTALVTASVLIAGDYEDGKKADSAREMKATVAIDKPAPDFTLTSVEGKTHSLSDFEGKYVVLEWINFDCPFVKKHYHSGNIPEMQKSYIESDEVVWLSICSSAPGKQGYFEGKKLKDRMKSEGWDATAYLIDADGTVGLMYGAKTTPHMYIIDKEGILRYAGAIDDIPSTKAEDIKDATNFVSAALQSLKADKAVATKTYTPYGCSVKYDKKAAAKSTKTM